MIQKRVKTKYCSIFENKELPPFEEIKKGKFVSHKTETASKDSIKSIESSNIISSPSPLTPTPPDMVSHPFSRLKIIF